MPGPDRANLFVQISQWLQGVTTVTLRGSRAALVMDPCIPCAKLRWKDRRRRRFSYLACRQAGESRHGRRRDRPSSEAGRCSLAVRAGRLAS
jgi:hypothetical protein